ncbi:MAG: hypothetical protein OXH96_18685 [Spirochaetaceae bacterium]|nr:hypothetical protein [Spirochaetaceae bacterium]
MAQVEPRYASDYDDRTTAAVRSVLVEIGQILGSYKGKFAVIGGAVPWLLLGEAEMPHVGTVDVDLSLDAEALRDGEYAQLVESLMRQGYHQRGNLRRFQLVRTVPAQDDGAEILCTTRRCSARGSAITSAKLPPAGACLPPAARCRRRNDTASLVTYFVTPVAAGTRFLTGSRSLKVLRVPYSGLHGTGGGG